jgi:hypothetical protein
MEFGAIAFDGTNNNGGGEMAFRVDGAVTSSANPSRWELYVTPAGTNSQTLGLKVDSSLQTTLYGNLKFADATTQSTAYKRTTGTWTVTAGTNNYSFEVPINGAYQLWVRGNIPNGIIAYQATVHVTNTNVPVLGTQRAWNYTGAGNPILLTTMPTQIVGAEGTISTASAVTTTANVFVFGISNTSGSNQTVSWGYTTL